MKYRTWKELAATAAAAVPAYAAARLAIPWIASRTTGIWPSVFALVLLPMLCGAAAACYLRKRGMRLWPGAAALAVLTVLLAALSRNLAAAAKLIKGLTGYYDPEATGFWRGFAILFCIGLLADFGAGGLLRRRGSAPK